MVWEVSTMPPVIPLHPCNTITSLPPPPRHRPRCSVEFVQGVSSIGEVGTGFPGSVMIRVANPLDEVLGGIATAAGVDDTFDFILHMVINGDRERRQDRSRAIRV